MTPKQFRDAARRTGCVDRRLFLAYAAGLSAIPLLGSRASAQSGGIRFESDPFTLGVASGDPTPRGVVLWTRLAPEPLQPAGGLPPTAIPIEWELAADEGFRNVVRKGTTLATPQLGHAVHVEVEGLAPDRWYFYRFRAADAQSPVGRTRTLPRRRAMPDRLRFAFASCQHFESGLFTAYQHMAEQDLDMVVHLGDYIYEGRGRKGQVREHIGGELHSLEDYRIRYAQYRSDPLLSGMHARCPWVVTWDDHEFDNNYAGSVSEEEGIDPVEFLIRRANAYQAYYEAMPLRRRSLPRGPHMRLYRKLSFGRLAEMMVLDTRQYRTDQPNGDRRHDLNNEARANAASLLGEVQRSWLESSLIASGGTWNVLAQQVMMATVDRTIGDERGYSMDQWPGYLFERNRLVSFLDERRVPNPVVLTGDIHSNWVNDLRVDDLRPESPVVATEFVGTSISSGGNGQASPPELDSLLAENPCVRFHNRERGYVACELTPESWRSDYIVVDDVTKPGGNVTCRASFAIEAGRPGAEPA